MPKNFLSEDFLLAGRMARRLYHEYAAGLPIFDYHCHLPVQEIAENRRFENLTRIWLAGDHYKWRAMRTRGVEERLITGDAPDEEKFRAWAGVVPYTVRNPLYHWTHMELKDPFGVDEPLNPETSGRIWEHCNRLLALEAFRARGLMERFEVKAVCTTDDPVDDLKGHQAIRADSSFTVKVLPAFRPDKAMEVEPPEAFNAWVGKLEAASRLSVGSYGEFLEALRRRHAFFHEMGCRLSDHGIEQPYAAEAQASEVQAAFSRLRGGTALGLEEIMKLKSAVLYELAIMNAERGWTQQFHFGALRNVNSRMMARLGPASGYDAIGDFEIARPLVRLLDRLDREGRLARTILYVLNPRDNAMIASIAGCFQEGPGVGKIQFGSAWWFNDTQKGMEEQMDTLSSIGLLSCFVGMLTDSRSFLSYPRHDYFRRILCNLIGAEVERGELPADLKLLGGIVQDICFRNAERYFAVTL